MDFRPQNTYYVYEDLEYLRGNVSSGQIPYTYYNFLSLDKEKYPDNSLLMSQIHFAYRTSVKIKVKNQTLFYYKNLGSTIIARTSPGNKAIEILDGRVASDDGWYEMTIKKDQIEEAWEERYPVDGFLLPENLKFKEPIDLASLNP